MQYEEKEAPKAPYRNPVLHIQSMLLASKNPADGTKFLETDSSFSPN